MDQNGASPSPQANSLRFYLLGPPRILWNGELASIDRHKALALLAYLCVTGRSHHRDKLTCLLWPEFDRTRGRAALRRVLASLTRVLPGDWWVTDRNNIAFFYPPRGSDDPIRLLKPDQFWFDVLEFHELRSAGGEASGQVARRDCPSEYLERLSRAVELFQGDFMEGFSLKDTASFDDWQMNQSETLRMELIETLEQLVHCHEQRKEYETAIHFCKRWIQLDPLEEKAHEELMRLYIFVGRPNTALQQYQSFRKLLESELGVIPQETITQLYQSIVGTRGTRKKLLLELQKNKPLPAYPKPVYKPGEPQKSGGILMQFTEKGESRPRLLPVPSIIIGREQELELARELWQRAKDGDTAMLLVSGEPGIGKTHFTRALVDQITHSDTLILQGECNPKGGPPYAPIAQAISECFLQPELENLAALLPAHVLADLNLIAPLIRARFPKLPANPKLGPVSDQQRIFSSILTFCEQLVRYRQFPLLLVLEDMHWSDVVSLQLLQYLVRRGRVGKLALLVVITFRDTETDQVTSSVLQDMVSDAKLQSLSLHVQLPGLKQNQTRDFVNNILGGDGHDGEALVTEVEAEAIYEQSEGNPFFIEELCRFLYEAGRFRGKERPGGWSEEGFISIPATIRELILSRLRRLSSPCQQVLQHAAFLGRQFDVDILGDLTGLEEETLISLLEEAIQAHLVLETQIHNDIKLSFAHQLIPFTLRETLSGLRRRREHQQVANYLESNDPGDLSGLAFHYAAAGNQVKAIQYAQYAARQAMGIFAFESALGQLRSVLDLVEVVRLPELHLSILEDLADVYRFMGNHTEAVAVLQEALSVWHRLPQKDRWSAIRLNRKIGETVTSMNQYADVQRLSAIARTGLESGLLLVKGEPAHSETVRLLAAISRFTWYMQSVVDWEAAEQYARASVKMAEELGNPVELSSALESLANVYGAKGHLRERVEVCLRRLALSYEPRFNDQKGLANILLQTGMAFYDVGDYTQSLGYLSQAESLGRQIRDIPVQADALVRGATCLFRLDRWDDLLGFDSKIRLLEAEFSVDRMGVLTCFFYALQSSVRFLRGEMNLAQVLKSEAFDVMISIAGPPEKWVRNQHF